MILIPFILILLIIAIGPLLFPHFWEKNLNKALIVGILTLPIAVYLMLHQPEALKHSTFEYLSFIILGGALFIVSGGIFLDGDLEATPLVNTAFLAVGALLASLIGTTGASMLLVRSLFHTNKERHHTAHLAVFFIFIVSNMGGMLTPIGDPPLFLGFLKGVPFFWTLKLLPIWLISNIFLLVLFFILDTIAHKKEAKKDLSLDHTQIEPLKLSGTINLLLLIGVVCGVFLPSPFREIEMTTMALISLFLTNQTPRKRNNFSFHPIIEVAVLFLGIFITMVPALQMIEAKGSSLGISSPFQFYWITGLLSSVLDNAPTYLTFFSLAKGFHVVQNTVAGVSEPILVAISAGSVMMGALTYIGNGPNFMVKAIASQIGIKTPSFLGYILYSVVILMPLFILISVVFF